MNKRNYYEKAKPKAITKPLSKIDDEEFLLVENRQTS